MIWQNNDRTFMLTKMIKDMINETNELKMKLEIVKSNISSLVDYLDENRLFSSPIIEPLWEYILAIEKVVGLDKAESE